MAVLLTSQRMGCVGAYGSCVAERACLSGISLANIAIRKLTYGTRDDNVFQGPCRWNDAPARRREFNGGYDEDALARVWIPSLGSNDAE